MAYALGNVKPAVRAVANKVGPMFGIRTIYGYSYRNIAGTTTLSDHATGRALDFMCGIATGNKLADYMKANAAQYGVTYIIHNRKIWSRARASEGWRNYTGANPHTDHVHVSFTGGSGSGTATTGTGTSGGVQNAGVDLTPWDGLLPPIPDLPYGGLLGEALGGVPSPGDVIGGAQDVAGAIKAMGQIVILLLQPKTWIRFFMFMVGLWMMSIGIGIMVKNTRAAAAVGTAVKTAAKTAAKAKVK